jgi:hypothetical protein
MFIAGRFDSRKISYIIDLVKLRYDFVLQHCEYTCQRYILGLKLSTRLEAQVGKFSVLGNQLWRICGWPTPQDKK